MILHCSLEFAEVNLINIGEISYFNLLKDQSLRYLLVSGGHRPLSGVIIEPTNNQNKIEMNKK